MRISNKDLVDTNNEILHRRIKKVEFPINDEDRKIYSAMRQYIIDSLDEELCEKYNISPAVGIAANQIGIDARVCALYIIDEDDFPIFDMIMVNPVIISHSSSKSFLESGEGCLSVKGIHKGYIYRSKEIKVKFFDLDGKKHLIELDGFLAIAVQHEIDHLNGILFTDKINKENPFLLKEDAYKI